MKRGSWLVLVLSLFAVGLNGCSTATKTTADGAGGSKEAAAGGGAKSGADTSGAATSGMAGAGGMKADPLSDPNSVLAKRVVYFDFDSSVVRDEFSSTLEAHANYLAEHPGVKVTLEGHCDERGTREYNLALGERRAQSVQQFMELMGAKKGQVTSISYGEERPAAMGHDEAAWHLNRRVEIVYQK